MIIRFATRADTARINALRRQVQELHAAGKPEVFKPGFPDELRDHIETVFDDPMQRIAVSEDGDALTAYAVLHHVIRPETPFMHARDFLDIDEFCVDAAHRRRGIGTALMRYIFEYAEAEGFQRVELNMWTFNEEALAFYESLGFTTYRRYMERKL